MWVAISDARRARLRRTSRRGVSIVYVGVAMLTLIGMVSLAVDLGRVRSTHEQLQNAADAGALAGVDTLPDNDTKTTDQTVVGIGAKNIADNKSIEIDPASDVEYGLWSPVALFDSKGKQILAAKTFAAVPGTIGGVNVPQGAANALRVTTKFLTARGNQVNLTFAAVLGVTKSEITTPATAWVAGGTRGFGFVGLDFVNFVGTTATDSYNAAAGAYNPGHADDTSSVSSNGDITVSGTVNINGDARPGVGHLVDSNKNSTITGWQAPLDTPLVFPPDAYTPPASSTGTITPANLVKGKTLKLTGSSVATFSTGSFVLDSISLSSNNVVLNITAPAKIYLNKDFSMNGGVLKILGGTAQKTVQFYVNGNFLQDGGSISNPYPAPPGALYISMTGANTTMRISSSLNAHIYAPLTDITYNGNAQNPPADFSGWAVGKSLTIKGNAELHYDESNDPLTLPRRGVLVK